MVRKQHVLHRLMTVMTAALVLTGPLLATAGPTQAAWAGVNGRIAYERTPADASTRLWWSNPDGTDASSMPFDETGFDPGSLLAVNNPEWAPDGRHLVVGLSLNCAYTGGAPCSNEIGYLDSVTGAVRQLTCDAVIASPDSDSECTTSQYGGVLSPDGTTVAFITDVLVDRLSGALQVRAGSIVTVPVTRTCGHNDCSGLSSSKLTDDPDGSYRSLSWSPDGNWLLATRTSAAGDDIVAVRTDGSGTLSHLTADLPRTRTYSDPRWSPSGAQVMVSGGGLGLLTFGVTCTPSACTRTSDPATFFTGAAYEADFSPDGTRAVLTRPFGGDGTTLDEVWTIDLSGVDTGLQRVTDFTALGTTKNPAWQNLAAPQPLTITTVSPAEGSSTPASANVAISGTFSGTAATASMVLAQVDKRGRRTSVAGSESCSSACASVTFTPNRTLRAGSYEATLTGATAAGQTVTRVWRFTITRR